MSTRTPIPDDELRGLLREAVDDIVPTGTLGEVLTRAHREAPAPNRGWMWASAAVLAGTAATVLAVATLSDPGSRGADPGPVEQPSVAPSVSPSIPPSTPSSPPGSVSPEPAPVGLVSVTFPIYFTGDVPPGDVRLYREFQTVTVRPDEGGEARPSSPAVLDHALTAAVAGDAADDDYRSDWPTGTAFASVRQEADVWLIDLRGDDALLERPRGMTEEAAEMAVQQLVYTLHGLLGSSPPVQLTLNGSRAPSLLGVPTSEPLAAASQNDVLTLASLSDPSEGVVVTDGSLEVRGRANSFEATVPWVVEDGRGQDFLDGFFTAEGASDRLYPFEGVIDVSGLAPGIYQVAVSTSDPSDGEGNPPHVDTRWFTIP